MRNRTIDEFPGLAEWFDKNMIVTQTLMFFTYQDVMELLIELGSEIEELKGKK